jgi:hypothetical protein
MAPAGEIAARCESLCGSGIQSQQLDCLKTTSCAKLATINDGASFDSVCPKAGAVDAGTSDGGE